VFFDGHRFEFGQSPLQIGCQPLVVGVMRSFHEGAWSGELGAGRKIQNGNLDAKLLSIM
jgi:hypothetical protein